jgi:quinol-cytochrome oxidoreductase complex cytochrome b subunit
MNPFSAPTLSTMAMNTKTAEKRSPLRGFVFHLHPRTVPESTLRFTLSFGLGGMAATLFIILLFSGILQLFSYAPETGSAYDSILAMYGTAPLAGLVRNIHHWSGHLLVIIALLHLLRVLLTGAADQRRRFNWLIGLGLFLLVLFGNFTGYLLPWDQRAYWAVTIFTNMVEYIPLFGPHFGLLLRGGTEVGQLTLSTFFAIHIGLIPALFCVLLIYHFWMIRKAGGLVRPEDPAGRSARRIATVPALISREAAVGLGVAALVFCFAALIDAPLGDMANPGESPNPAKAAWYFMGLQELLLHFHPVFAICIIPLTSLLLLALVPFIPGAATAPGIWCGGSRGRKLAALAFTLGLLACLGGVLIDDLLLNSTSGSGGLPAWVSRGIVPLFAIVTAQVLVYLLLSRQRTYGRAASIMALLLLNFGLICGLTIIGTWFRGPSMMLTPPW